MDFDPSPSPKAAFRSRLKGPLEVNDPVRDGIPAPLKGGFQELFGTTLGHIRVEGIPFIPMHTSTGPIVSVANKDRTYRLPQVGEVEEVKVDHIRAAAYIPDHPGHPGEGVSRERL